MLNKQTFRDVNLKGKKVLIRVDFNVPQDANGNITDDNKIREALPTIEYVCHKGGKAILCSHLGRPEGIKDKKFSLAPVAKRLQEIMGKKVIMAPDCIGPEVEKLIEKMKEGDIILLENVRFYGEETDNDTAFARKLASLAQIFVNDAFGTAHRAHASTEGVATFLPAVSGLLIEKELSVLGGALENPKRPLVVVLGGAKVSDKIGVVNNLLNIAHTILIGGGMMFTFIKAMGGHVGKSKVDNTHLDFCKEVLKKAKQKHVQIVIAQDCVAADALSENSNTKVVASNKIPDDLMGLDIGPKSIKEFETILKKAGTVVWNGPLGVFEWDKFAAGTNSVATTIAASKAISIVCGGDTAFAVTKLNIGEKFTHISTGGGASLEFFEGKDLPGIAALNNKR